MGGPAQGDGVRRSLRADPQGARRPRRHGVGDGEPLIEAVLFRGREVAEPALHLIGEREGGHEIPSGGAGVLRRRKHSAHVVARVRGAHRAHVAVADVEIADERGVVEGRPVGGGRSPADEGAAPVSPEIVGLRA